jgi:hypothetical protein
METGKFVKNDYEHQLSYYLELGVKVIFSNPDDSLDDIDNWYEVYGEPENIAVFENCVVAMYF